MKKTITNNLKTIFLAGTIALGVSSCNSNMTSNRYMLSKGSQHKILVRQEKILKRQFYETFDNRYKRTHNFILSNWLSNINKVSSDSQMVMPKELRDLIYEMSNEKDITFQRFFKIMKHISEFRVDTSFSSNIHSLQVSMFIAYLVCNPDLYLNDESNYHAGFNLYNLNDLKLQINTCSTNPSMSKLWGPTNFLGFFNGTPNKVNIDYEFFAHYNKKLPTLNKSIVKG